MREVLELLVRNINYAADIRDRSAEVGSVADVRAMARMLKPLRACGFYKTRLGGPADGGYVMIDDFADVTDAFSLGVGDDMSWDIDLSSRHINVHQYDHTIEQPPKIASNITFHRKKISAGDGGTTIDLDGLVKTVSQAGKLILKMDIEHDEWDVLDKATLEALARFKQVICEFHWFGK